jgi:hypothetical protein
MITDHSAHRTEPARIRQRDNCYTSISSRWLFSLLVVYNVELRLYRQSIFDKETVSTTNSSITSTCVWPCPFLVGRAGMIIYFKSQISRDK